MDVPYGANEIVSNERIKPSRSEQLAQRDLRCQSERQKEVFKAPQLMPDRQLIAARNKAYSNHPERKKCECRARMDHGFHPRRECHGCFVVTAIPIKCPPQA